jgi:hypothetical protein
MPVALSPAETIQSDPNTPPRRPAVAAATAPPCAEERWAAIPGFEGLYEVSSCGRVRRSASRMAPASYLLKPRRTWDGYVHYGLSKRRRYRHIKVHRLVALAFLGPPPFPGAHVAHFDGDKTNNHLPNLRWATPAENEADKRRHGRCRGARPGERHHRAKLTAAQVAELRRLAATGRQFAALAPQFGVARLTAYDAIYGITWKTVSEPPPLPRRRRKAA